MEMTTLDNVAIGMMLVLAFLGIIIVVWNCAKLEKRIIRLEERTDRIEDFYIPARLEILEVVNGIRFYDGRWSYRHSVPLDEEIKAELDRISYDPGPCRGKRGAFISTKFPTK